MRQNSTLPRSNILQSCDTPQSCDTMVALGNATHNGQTIFAKNSDRPADECQPLVQRTAEVHAPASLTQCQFVTLPQTAVTYRHVGSRPHWCWGYEHGFNEHQVVIGNEALPSKLPAADEPKLVGMELLRLGLERARTAAEAVDVITTLVTHYGQGKFANDAGVRTYDNGYIVADPSEAYVIETAGHEWAVQRVQNAIGISNVYSVETGWDQTSPTARQTAIANGGWRDVDGRLNFANAYTASSRTEGSGAMRRARSCAVLGGRVGGIDAQTMMAILADHGDGVTPDEPFQTQVRSSMGICRHPEPDGSGGCTAASLVADLCADGSRLPVYWCSFYSPCLGLFLPIFCEGTIPSILANGGATFSNESPWWRFHRLNQMVLQDPARLTPLVRRGWAKLQRQLLESAYPLAQEARLLIDSGRDAEAKRLLTDYMMENVLSMTQTTDLLLTELTDLLEEEAVPA